MVEGIFALVPPVAEQFNVLLGTCWLNLQPAKFEVIIAPFTYGEKSFDFFIMKGF